MRISLHGNLIQEQEFLCFSPSTLHIEMLLVFAGERSCFTHQLCAAPTASLASRSRCVFHIQIVSLECFVGLWCRKAFHIVFPKKDSQFVIDHTTQNAHKSRITWQLSKKQPPVCGPACFRFFQVFAHSIIMATGATAKRLGIPSEQIFWSKGISACAICDGE